VGVPETTVLAFSTSPKGASLSPPMCKLVY
jgi:hypothetical protein